MGMDKTEATRLETYTFLHNPTICRDMFHKKHVEGKPIATTEQFSNEESEKLDTDFETFMEQIDKEGELQLATNPAFFTMIADQEGETITKKTEQMPFSDLLVYYMDAIFDDSTLMPAHNRIALMENRRPDLNGDPSRTAQLGMPYWDAERIVSTHIQKMIWGKLKENGTELASHEDVPEFIRKKMAQDMLGST